MLKTDDNRSAVAEFIGRARSLSAEQWITPRAPDKWAPFQEARHLLLSYQAFTDAVLGLREISPRVPPERSKTIYDAVVPRLMAGAPLPSGATTPAEAEPGNEPASSDTLLQELEQAAFAFHAAINETLAADPTRRVRHPYFGPLSLSELAVTAVAHTRHHMGHLPEHTS